MMVSVFLIFVFSCLTKAFTPGYTYASFQITGNSNSNGIYTIKSENNKLTVPENFEFFSTGNMMPGGSKTSDIKIVSSNTLPFTLKMKAEIPDSDGSVDEDRLSSVMNLQIIYNEQDKYTGTIDKFISSSGIDLGKFTKGDISTLNFKVGLPGEELGNEYADKDMKVNWIFTAYYDEGEDIPDEPVPGGPTDIPKTGEVNPLWFYGSGIVFIAAGFVLLISKNKK